MMTLSTTVIENGREVRLSRPRDHAGHRVEIQIDAAPPVAYECPTREACYDASTRVMTELWGRDRGRGGTNATNSMVWEMTNLIERLAGC